MVSHLFETLCNYRFIAYSANRACLPRNNGSGFGIRQYEALNNMKKWLLVVVGIVALLVLVVIFVQNKSARWEKIGVTPTLDYYADASSVLKSGNSAAIWLLADNKEAQIENGKSYISSKQKFEIDCSEAKKRLVRFTLYSEHMGGGSEVASRDLPDNEWSAVMQGTVSGSMWALSCKPWWKFWN